MRKLRVLMLVAIVLSANEASAVGIADFVSAGINVVGKVGGAMVDKAMEDSPEEMERKRQKEAADREAKFHEAIAKIESRTDITPLDKEKLTRQISKTFGMAETISNLSAQQELRRREQRDQILTGGGIVGVVGDAALNTPSAIMARADIAVKTGVPQAQPFIALELKAELAKLPYPRFYLDFETINLIIPRWAGTRPHQQLPFQWSCHIERQGGELEHREFLETSGDAPMRPFAESLIAAVEDEGPIIVYGTFESTVIKGLIDFYPDMETPLNDILDRLVNLLPWLQNHYYHPAMKGSWSIKAVLPTVAAHLDYTQLEDVQNGTLAQLAYLDIINPDTESALREQKIRNLLKYCELDTQAMVEVVRFFG